MTETIIRVGPRPAIYQGRATFFDGMSPVPHDVALGIDEVAGALVFEAGGDAYGWPLDDVREVPDQAGGDLFVLRLKGDPLAQLVLGDRDLAPRLPNRKRRAPTANRGRIARWAAAALGSVALIIFVLVPIMADQLARFIPPEGERALGEVTLNQIRNALGPDSVAPVAFCEDPDGMAALDTIRDRLAGGTPLPQDLSVHVLDHEMVNAFALPGGFIVFFRGLIDAAETPEEIAAVFAHEVGHVVSRDPTRHALRSAGSIGVLGLILGDFAGGAAVLFLTERLIEARYSQAAETGADVFAYGMLERADISPAALGAMFERFRDMGGEPPAIMTHFMSHPELSERIEGAEAAVPEGFDPAPLLSESQFRALKGICD
ncbi:Metalloprotease LoiP precursor [Roseivivax sp. THAF40]|uniref:M48 family metallopeptidase n=1 Tax=unclassified Roseivivax TaxID=2639302 RepID=UPI00126892D2|nr:MULTISPECIES: M48 family metallopeptidase [unclassified Roseivivax]QFS81626.1 Metalloprotease LoiP precursor [Roseivivax sp. THAF197b]QFT45355.1 Metalloprotease LoiP precursor [Roseivivax sp. THAF40]